MSNTCDNRRIHPGSQPVCLQRLCKHSPETKHLDQTGKSLRLTRMPLQPFQQPTHRIISVADPGTVLNPNIAANNIEGGVAWGLSAAFLSEITFNRGRTVQSNFHDFRVLRMSEMPPVEVYFVDSGARPLGGIGEVGPVTVVPAVANAIFAATGQRYRSLPLSRHGLRLVGSYS